MSKKKCCYSEKWIESDNKKKKRITEKKRKKWHGRGKLEKMGWRKICEKKREKLKTTKITDEKREKMEEYDRRERYKK